MPMYDLACQQCGAQRIDVLQAVEAEQPLCECGAHFTRAWLTKPSNVIGDECDVWVSNALCHADGSPRRFTSKAEMKRVAAEKGWTNYVQHIGAQGSDKSKHTSRWI